MSETTEKKLTGLAALNEKRRLEREQKAGISKEAKTLNEPPKMETATIEENKPLLNPTTELEFGIDPKKIYVFQTVEKSGSPRHQMFNSKGKMFDGNRIRAIRYIPVADTIFVDEQGDRYKDYPDEILSFHRDLMPVSGTDKRLVEFMLSNDDYDGNPHRLSPLPPVYTLVNKFNEEDAKEALFNAKLRAMNVVNDNDIKELYPIARVVFNIMDKDETTVKNKLRALSETQPQLILNNIDSPRVKRGYVVQSGLDRGIIEVNMEKRSLVWSSSKAYIMEIKAVKDAGAQLTEITDFTFTDEGNKMYDVLKAKVAS